MVPSRPGSLMPAGIDAAAATGRTVEFGFVARPDGTGPQLQAIIGSEVAEAMKPIGAAQFASLETGDVLRTSPAGGHGRWLSGLVRRRGRSDGGWRSAVP